MPRPKKREKNGRFQVDTGMCIDSEGYLRLTAGPLRGMRLHVLIAIAKWGLERVRKKGTVVHHKDNNKLNNWPDNLQLKTAKDHNAISAKQYWYLKKHVWNREKEAYDDFFKDEKKRKKHQPDPEVPF